MDYNNARVTRYMKLISLCIILTSAMLQNPAIELDDRVSKQAAVPTLAAVLDLMATQVKLVLWVQRTHLTIEDIV